MTKYEFHPLSEKLPLMNAPDHTAFTAHLGEHGQLVPIVLFEGKILDGRNRYNACVKNKIEPRVAHYNKKQAREYVIGANLYRRHYTRVEQEHYLTRLIAEQDALGMTNKEVAQAAGVSVPTVERKRKEKRKKPSKPGGLMASSPGKDEKPAEPEIAVDENGTPITKAAKFWWDRLPEAKDVLGQIKAAKAKVKKLIPDDAMWCEVNLNGVLGDLSSAINRFSAAIPSYVCPYCKGVKVESCKGCKGRGVVSKFMYSMAPDEMKPK